jgi:hypothetical protein
MPKSIWAACALPRMSPSRLAVQLPNFVTLDSIPCLRKNPFECATTIGAQSVKGRIPNVSCLTSGSPTSATSTGLPRAISDDKSKPLNEETATPGRLRVRSVSVCLLLDGIHSDQPFKFLTAKPLA